MSSYISKTHPPRRTKAYNQAAHELRCLIQKAESGERLTFIDYHWFRKHYFILWNHASYGVKSAKEFAAKMNQYYPVGDLL